MRLTDGPTVKVTYRVACTRLKTLSEETNELVISITGICRRGVGGRYLGRYFRKMSKKANKDKSRANSNLESHLEEEIC